MEFHMDPVGGVGSASPEHQPSADVRRLVRRTPASGDGAAGDASGASPAGGSALSSPSPPAAAAGAAAPTATQTVGSEAEGNALIKRIRQLESEGAMLSNTLTKVCEENGRLSGQISALEEKVQALAQEPLKGTSVLHSLFEPEKTGWFGGSKSAAREQLEQLSDALQSEFMAYKASHASSNDEVQALGNSCAAMMQEMQAQMRRVREQAARTEDALRSSQAELHAMKAENAKLRNDSVASSTPVEPASAAPMPAGSSALLLSEKSSTEALERMTSERDALHDALAEARNAIVEKDKDVELQKHKVAQLENKLAAKDSVHMEEVDKLRQQLANSFSASVSCGQCAELRQELETARRDVDASHITVQDLRSQILEMTVQQEEKYNALEKRLADALDQLSEKDEQLRHLTSADDYENLKLEQESLTREIDLYKQRIAFLETSRSASDDAANATALDETKVLETLNATKERISKLEFERDQLAMQLQQAQSYAVSRDAEARQLQQRSEDDKKRVTFLMKKCASLTADVRSATTQLDTFKEQFEKQSLELKQERRNTEGMAKLQKQFDELSKEKRLLEDRLAATQEVEERLVKAKETIAYMELAQSSTICMSQFAELKAEKEKLQNTMEPLDRKLEEAKQEIERLKAVTDAQHAISETQNKNVRAWQDQVTALSESEAKLRDKVAVLTAENTRLTQVNASLEQQMNDMQDGIKEMAVHMEKDRASAKAAAEANAQKQIQTLCDELAQARATIAEVQARDGQYVADGLYQSVVAERDRSLEENKKITVELEKRKSEISIYRQTIADLEQENDERVKEIESLQDRYQSDRAALNDRLAKEQKRTAELSSSVAGLTEHVSAMEAEAAKHTSTIAELQEKNAKQQRVFEDKCRREEALSDEIKRLNGQITPAVERCSSAVVEPETEVKATDRAALLSSLNPAAPTASRPLLDRLADGAAAYAASAPEPIAIDAFCKRIEDLQRDNDRLNSELKRIELQHRTDSANDQHMITVLQTQIKNRMSTNNRAAYEAEIAKSAALKKSIEALMEENVKLRKQAGVAQVSANMPASALSVAMAGAQQMDVLQLQSQLQAQKATYDSAMEAAAKAAEAYEARIHELEDLLDKPVKRRVKKIKRKKTLAEQVGATNDGEDILAASPQTDAAAATENSAEAGQLQASLMLAHQEVDQLKLETMQLTSENTQLKATVADLLEQLQRAEEDVKAANEDMDMMQTAMDEERGDLRKKIDLLEQQSMQRRPGTDERQLTTPLRNTSSVHNGSDSPSKANRSFRNSTIVDLEMQLRRCQDEVERLTAENRNLQYRLEREETQRTSSLPATTAALMPTKEKLVEYMAMADRLGLRYPFPPELEGATVLRLKALHLPVHARSASAPTPAHQWLHRMRSGGKVDEASPPPRTPRARYTGGGGGAALEKGEDFSRR
ncbi:hypothetical protein CGC21_32525 [Leishmania donovani]|uniref:Uncharacterized protein n=1 Tax=Leishmania donovani TaxID=5661 RepID=A0A504WZH0_LEIDO|nr:hypothetical protein CGC21_32525 [Leishmania donovani]